MKKIAVPLLFALCTGTMYTQYSHFESMKDLCDAVSKQSVKINACLKKHRLFDLDPCSVEFVSAINDLINVSEHELAHNQALKKQFISSLWIGRLEGCFELKDYAQAIAFCDIALDIDPDNALLYAAKSEIYKELGNAEQADIYRKIAIEKGIDDF